MQPYKHKEHGGYAPPCNIECLRRQRTGWDSHSSATCIQNRRKSLTLRRNKNILLRATAVEQLRVSTCTLESIDIRFSSKQRYKKIVWDKPSIEI